VIAKEELLASLRDELRKAAPSNSTEAVRTTCPGARLREGSIIAALSSWQTLVLFAFKPVVHWLFGLSMTFMEVGYAGTEWFGGVLSLRATPTFVLAGTWILLAVFATLLALRRPKGYQPAAWGQLPLLEKLVEDWGVLGEGEETRLCWRDKVFRMGGGRLVRALTRTR
jgi:hypothetical protein